MKSRRDNVASAFIAVAAVLAVSIGFTYWMGLIAVDSAQKVASQRSVIQQLDDLFSVLKDLEIGQRGYLLTGEEPYLKLFSDAVARFNADIANLHRLVRTGDLPAENVDAMSRLAADRLAELQNIIRLRQREGLDSALA